MPNYTEDELFSMVGKDEKILWSGKPDLKCFILEALFNPLLPFALVWALFDSMFIGAFAFADKGGKDFHFMIIPLIAFFALHLMPVWIYLFGVVFSWLKYKHTFFIITEKGVYCSGGMFSKTYEHKPFTELSHINIHRGIFDQWLGVGDVVLSSNQDGYNTRNARHCVYRGITICDIPDYQNVYNTVKQLQTDIYSDTMYPNDLRPKENHGYQTQYNPFREIQDKIEDNINRYLK